MFRDIIKKQCLVECKKAGCRRSIEFHTKNVILQSVVSFLFITAGLFYSRRQDPLVPFVIVPSATVSLSKLVHHEKRRRECKKMLADLEKE